MMRIAIIITCLFQFLVSSFAFGFPEPKEQDYLRMVNLVKPIRIHHLETKNTQIAGIELSDYGYTEVYQYVVASQTLTLFVLGKTSSDESLLASIDLGTERFMEIFRLTSHEFPNLLSSDLSFAICFLDHFFSKERLRYVFLTYSTGTNLAHGSKIRNTTFLKAFRRENDETSAYIQIASTNLGEVDMYFSTPPEAPYAFVKNASSSGTMSAEPARRSFSRILLADVNHDSYMDIVLWKRHYIAKRSELIGQINRALNIDKCFALAHEEIQVMFFDWETITFSEPVTMPTDSLNKEHLWRLLFPSDWFHHFDDWMETSEK